MIELLVLRHAQAEDSASSDFARRLTAKGERQSQAVGVFCLDQGFVPDLILTSPVVRARQTADLAAAAMSSRPPVTLAPGLACGAAPEAIFSALREADECARRLMIVGHEPDLGEFLVHALGCQGGDIEVKKAALACLSLHALRQGAATLRFLLPPKILSGR